MTYCETIAAQLPELFGCTPHDKYVRIRTPFLYPDGDIIDLFVRDIGGTLVVTDLGESLRWLKSQTLSPRRSPKQRQLLEDICVNHGLDLYKGMLTLRVKEGENLGAAVIRVSQGALRAADLWFTLRNRAVQSVTDEVADFLDERELKYQRGEKLAGRSGRTWPVDFHVFAPEASSLVYVLTSGSRASARAVAEHVLAAWYDLSHMNTAQHVGFVSLFDDTQNVWGDEDFNLLAPLSTIARWSRPDDLVQALRPAA